MQLKCLWAHRQSKEAGWQAELACPLCLRDLRHFSSEEWLWRMSDMEMGQQKTETEAEGFFGLHCDGIHNNSSDHSCSIIKEYDQLLRWANSYRLSIGLQVRYTHETITHFIELIFFQSMTCLSSPHITQIYISISFQWPGLCPIQLNFHLWQNPSMRTSPTSNQKKPCWNITYK